MHGGAKGSGAPHGERNGNFKHGRFTFEAIQERRTVMALVKAMRSLVTKVEKVEKVRIIECGP
jgi:hypothetical protein